MSCFYRICAEMAELSTNAREYEKAINFYKEGLTYDETHLPVIVNVLNVISLFCIAHPYCARIIAS